jgi:hypothetical protein
MGAKMGTIEPGARELLEALGGPGGGWSNFWTGPEAAPIWWTAGHPPKNYPEYWQSVYFSLAPRINRLPGKRRGGLAELKYLTCLYSEMDEKDGRTWADVESLDPQPGAIVRSGGGWHCYWFISPVTLTDDNREELNQTQHEWTTHTHGDPGAPDISRVLRLPGSWNCKYNPPRKVELLHLKTSLRYDVRELQALLPKPEAVRGAGRVEPRAVAAPQQFDSEHWLNRALEMARPGNRARVAFWLACQLRDGRLSQSEAFGVLERYQAHVDTTRDHYTPAEGRSAVKSAYRTQPREAAPVNAYTRGIL